MRDIQKIFFESSSLLVGNLEDREKFYQKWCGQYLKLFPHWFYTYWFNYKIVGYLCCSPGARGDSHFVNPNPAKYQEWELDFPAHFHINVDSSFRGKMIGKIMVENLIVDLKAAQICGVHVVTGLEARNRSFYQRLDFRPIIHDDKTVFLGLKL